MKTKLLCLEPEINIEPLLHPYYQSSSLRKDFSPLFEKILIIKGHSIDMREKKRKLKFVKYEPKKTREEIPKKSLFYLLIF